MLLCLCCYLTQDLIEKGHLNLKLLKFRVLDEADEMLNMGFVDDVELILGMPAFIFFIFLNTWS
jgi:superfamily II DNA/RNA helicase